MTPEEKIVKIFEPTMGYLYSKRFAESLSNYIGAEIQKQKALKEMKEVLSLFYKEADTIIDATTQLTVLGINKHLH
jgi:hypothetical protein